MQTVGNNSSAVGSSATLIPSDDSIPQITEGFEVLSQAITPSVSANTLLIRANVMLSAASAQPLIIALFQDATSNALHAMEEYQSQTAGVTQMHLMYRMTAGTTSSTTFRIRAGSNGDTTTVNGASATRRFGTAAKSGIFITEYRS